MKKNSVVMVVDDVRQRAGEGDELLLSRGQGGTALANP